MESARTPVEAELAHMLRMLSPPFFEGWKDEIERKAKSLEADPEYAGLWDRLKAEVQARGWHKSQPKAEAPPSAPTS